MADKISVKTLLAIFLFCGIVLILCVCMHPIDIQVFLEDPQVQEIIETTRIAVKVDDMTGDNLKGVRGKIEGLKNNKYYMVEKEIDADDVPVTPTEYPKYVTDYNNLGINLGPGGLIDDLGLITRISGGSINGLTNLHTYTVRAAIPLAPSGGSLPYTDGGGASPKQVTNGVITISGMKGTGRLDLSTIITTGYEAIAVSVDDPTSSPWNWTCKTTNWNSFELEGPGTTTDYVFVKTSAPLEFKVLKVIIELPGNVNFTAITFTFTDKSGVSANNNRTISRGTFNGGNKVTLTLATPTGGGSWDAGSIKWSIGGITDTVTANHVNSSGQLGITNSDDFLPVFAAASFNVTVYAALGGIPYSAAIPITVVN